MSRFGEIILAMALVLLLAASVLLFAREYAFLAIPPEIEGREMVVAIEPGWSFDRITRELATKGLVTSERGFVLLGRATGSSGRVRAGEFALRTDWTPLRLLEELKYGREVQHRFSVREGLTWWETADVVAAAGFGTAARFSALAFDPELLRAFDIPARNAEGYLFPQTYSLPRSANMSGAAIEAMLRQFRKVAAEIWPGGLPAPEELHRLVILASLVEKETAVPGERARVAGVYVNRLKRGMLLQCDPTVIYGLGAAFNGNLTKAHLLDDANPYNTYRHPGLPPGPICSPGQASLEAAAHPEEHDYLYFVSTNDGAHVFSRTLEEHNRAVARYQLQPRRSSRPVTGTPGNLTGN